MAAAIGSALLAAAPAAALTYAYSFASTGGDAGSGFLTTATAGTSSITSITGTFDGSAVTALSPYAGANNILTPSGPYVSIRGVSVSTAGGTNYNLYFQGSNYGITDSFNDPGGTGVGKRILTSFSVTAVPEPATWGLMIVGFGMTGFAARRRTNAMIA